MFKACQKAYKKAALVVAFFMGKLNWVISIGQELEAIASVVRKCVAAMLLK